VNTDRQSPSAAPAVTVIMNIRDGEEYLRESIDSVLAQSFEDFELICFDDMSKDASVAIVQSYHDPRIRLIHSELDLTLGKARCAAIGHARAPWLAFCDQDDLWMPRKLEWQMRFAGDPEVGLIYGRTVMFRDGRDLRDADHRHEFTALPRGHISRNLVRESCFIRMCSVMLRTDAVRALGLMPLPIDVSPDYWYYLGLADRWEARAIDRVVCRYRVHARNLTRTTGMKIHTEVLWVLGQFGSTVPAPDLRAAARVHETNLAVHMARTPGRRIAGIKRLLTRGSLPYLFSRPFARALRALKRSIIRPMWRRAPLGGEHDRAESTTPVLGTLVSVFRFDDAVAHLASLVRARRGVHISAANAYSVTLAERNATVQAIMNDAAMVTTDGMPVVWTLRLLGVRADRVHNDDLAFACFHRFPAWKHYLVGGREGQPEAVRDALRARYPGAQIVGCDATPVRPVPPRSTDAIVARIAEARPDIVWVGMGTPAQDIWMHTAARRGDVPMVGCGSLFDLLTGRTAPTPAWMKRIGLQWLFRLAQEPRRLAKRYLVYNTLFVMGACKQLLFERTRKGRP